MGLGGAASKMVHSHGCWQEASLSSLPYGSLIKLLECPHDKWEEKKQGKGWRMTTEGAAVLHLVVRDLRGIEGGMETSGGRVSWAEGIASAKALKWEQEGEFEEQ